jgi:hypothetical protein
VATGAASGFYESGVADADEPLWDELDLPGIAETPSAPAGAEAQPHGGKAAGSDVPRPPLDIPAGLPSGDTAARIAQLLGPVPVSVDDLARLAEVPARQVRTILSGLELAGKIEWQGGDLVSARPDGAGRLTAPPPLPKHIFYAGLEGNRQSRARANFALPSCAVHCTAVGIGRRLCLSLASLQTSARRLRYSS